MQLPASGGGALLPAGDIVGFLLDHPTSPAYQTIGSHLFGLLHSSGIGEQWADLRALHAAPKAEGLRTVLEIRPLALRELPWETLIDGNGQVLFLDEKNPCLRGAVDFADLGHEVGHFIEDDFMLTADLASCWKLRSTRPPSAKSVARAGVRGSVNCSPTCTDCSPLVRLS